MRHPCKKPTAFASVTGGSANPNLQGTVTFLQCTDGTLVTAKIQGLPQSTQTGFFAIHIHEGDGCGGSEFSQSAGHYNPANVPHPSHAGDLPPLLSTGGHAYMSILTGRFCVEEVIGKTVIIHSDPDDFHSQPAGNAGRKIGCGVIRRVQDR